MSAASQNGWTQVSLGEILHRRRDGIRIQDIESYKRITVRLNGLGVALRNEAQGSEIGTKTQFRVRSGQFILSKIDARNGAFGIVPLDCDDAIITGNFWTFDVNVNRLDANYFYFLTRTPLFVDFCIRASEGTTNRRYLQEDRFLSQQTALPPLAEQRRIVAKIDRLAAKIDEARALRRRTADEVQILQRVLYHEAEQLATVAGRSCKLGEIIRRHDSGWSPQCDEERAGHDCWGVLKTTCVQWHGFDATANKALRPTQEPRPDIVVADGDVLITRAGPVNRVGVACTVRNPPPRLMLSDKIVRVIPNNEVLPEFLTLMLGTPRVQEYFRQGKTGLAESQVNISRDKLLDLRLNVPSHDEQLRIVTFVDAIKAQANDVTRQQSDTAAELDALLPSILDRAFKGAL
jgi:type I restriction enzyme S subunit